MVSWSSKFVTEFVFLIIYISSYEVIAVFLMPFVMLIVAGFVFRMFLIHISSNDVKT